MMLLYTIIIVFFAVGSFHVTEGRAILRKGSPLATESNGNVEEESKLRFKRDAEESSNPNTISGDTEALSTAEKHRTDTIEQYRKEAADRMHALNERLKNRVEEPKPNSSSVKEGITKLDSEIKGLETELADATDFLDEEEKPKIPKKTKAKTKVTVTTSSDSESSRCSSILGKLGCLLG